MELKEVLSDDSEETVIGVFNGFLYQSDTVEQCGNRYASYSIPSCIYSGECYNEDECCSNPSEEYLKKFKVHGIEPCPLLVNYRCKKKEHA